MHLHVCLTLDHAADDAFFVDDVGDAGRQVGIFPPDSIGLARLIAGPVAEEGEADTEFPGVDTLGGLGVYADAQDLGVGLLEVLEDIVEALHLPASAGGKGQQIEGQDDVFLALEVVQGDLIALGVPEGKIGGRVADLKGHGFLLASDALGARRGWLWEAGVARNRGADAEGRR